MRVGWLADPATYVGGAELTQSEFRAAAPEDVTVVDCPPGAVDPTCDRYAIHNCVLYTPEDLANVNAPAVKYHHDVGPHIQPAVKDWLARNTTQVCCSPVQADYMGLAGVLHIPPPVDLDRFSDAADGANGHRAGAVSVGSWRNYGKAPHRAAEWAAGNGGIDFYGSGAFAPDGSKEVPYDDMPDLLARYRTFVFLPTVIEPFGRVVAEAWAAGCEIVTNRLVGARYWITENPVAIETAAEDFWQALLDA